MSAWEQLSQIVIHKQSQRQRDQNIIEEWRKARRQFFTQIVRNAIKQVSVEEYEQQQIYEKYLRQTLNYVYNLLFIELEDIYGPIKGSFERKQRQCGPIMEIVDNKCSSLKRILIEYNYEINQFGDYSSPYSINASQFFKVLSSNKLLSQVTVKGVLVQKLQNFIKSINPNNDHPKTAEKLGWSADLKTSNKSIQLSIDSLFIIIVEDRQSTLDCIDDFNYFKGLFSQLSDIKIRVALMFCGEINKLVSKLAVLWKSIRTIRRLKLRVEGLGYKNSFPKCHAPLVRSALFGEGLTSLTEISELQFANINFDSQVEVNDLLAIEQNLNILFENNNISHLKLEYCRNFPVLPSIFNLKSICVRTVQFRRQVSFVSETINSNASLKYLRCQEFSECEIQESLINSLQVFIIQYSEGFPLSKALTQECSNLKYLKISSREVDRSMSLSLLFPKLYRITYLYLQNIRFGDSLLCIIPSANLQHLHILNNDLISDKGLQAIDKKWPYLRSLTIKMCQNVSEDIWTICEFRGLFNLDINQRLYGETREYLQLLKSRGINMR